MIIVGLDAAVKDKDIGCIRGEYSNGSFTVTDRWNRKDPLVEAVVDWIQNSKQAILAIDAPLGWPVNFRKILNAHCAGRALKIDPDLFFKRQTDLDIKNRFKKTTLEITADRIARTAFFTLERVGRVENKLGNVINLLWKPEDLSRFGMIEVYPAATLLANGLSIKGYKKNNTVIRNQLYEDLKTNYSFINNLDLTTVEHDFDAFICCLSCIDFIEGKSMAPDDITQRIQEEGWIWVRGKTFKEFQIVQ